jgi:hypothetical protein
MCKGTMSKKNDIENEGDRTNIAVHRMVSEWFDGYLIVGFTAKSKIPMIIGHMPDPKTVLAIKALMADAISCELNSGD